MRKLDRVNLMDGSYQQIGELIARVRARWRRLLFFRASLTAALTAAVVLLVALGAAYFTGRSPNALAAIGVVAALLALLSISRALWPVRRRPTDKQVARFIEEREPSLDDRLVSAVDVASWSGSADAPAQPGLSGMLLADADRRASLVDPSTIVTGEVLRRAGFQAAGALLVLAAIAYVGRGAARQSVDALSLALFPSHVTLEVKPGNARLRVGDALEHGLLGARGETGGGAELGQTGIDAVLGHGGEPLREPPAQPCRARAARRQVRPSVLRVGCDRRQGCLPRLYGLWARP